MRKKVAQGADRLDTITHLLRGQRIGLITAPTGVTRSMNTTADLLHARHHLTALFACEHGIRGEAQAGVSLQDAVDGSTGVPIFSLYGQSQRLTDEMGDLFDVLVYDISDVGVRCYTYLSTLAYAMHDCARMGKPVIVLDRINPLGGEKVEGLLLSDAFRSFIGPYAMPTRYGLTVGEYAHYVDFTDRLDLDLTVVKLEGWSRAMDALDTDLCFIPPSPNIPTPQAALLYAGTCLFEGTNLSEGRGTTLPFEWIGAPWVDADRLTQRMRACSLPGVLFRRVCFQPVFSKYAGEVCHGVQMHVVDRHAFEPITAALCLLDAVRALHPGQFQWIAQPDDSGAHYPIDLLLGTDAYRTGDWTAESLINAHRPLVRMFQERARIFHLYE